MKNTLLLMLAVAAAGCDTSREGNESPRIFYGQSVDGISFGDHSATVEARLGPADCLGRNAWGESIWVYESGEHAGVNFLFGSQLPGGELGISGFFVAEPYDGKDVAGVGIGATRAALERSIGTPDTVIDAPGNGALAPTVTYAFQAYRLIVTFRAEKVASITMALNDAHLSGMPRRCSGPIAGRRLQLHPHPPWPAMGR